MVQASFSPCTALLKITDLGRNLELGFWGDFGVAGEAEVVLFDHTSIIRRAQQDGAECGQFLVAGVACWFDGHGFIIVQPRRVILCFCSYKIDLMHKY